MKLLNLIQYAFARLDPCGSMKPESNTSNTSVAKSIKVVFGVPNQMKPIVFAHGVEVGKVRVRLRPGKVAEVFIKTPHGIAGYYAKDEVNHWVVGPNLCIGKNVRQ